MPIIDERKDSYTKLLPTQLNQTPVIILLSSDINSDLKTSYQLRFFVFFKKIVDIIACNRLHMYLIFEIYSKKLVHQTGHSTYHVLTYNIT